MGLIDNASSAVKLLAAKKKFEKAHPKFTAFTRTLLTSKMEAGTIIAVKVTRPDGSTMETNMKVKSSDLKIFKELNELMNH